MEGVHRVAVAQDPALQLASCAHDGGSELRWKHGATEPWVTVSVSGHSATRIEEHGVNSAPRPAGRISVHAVQEPRALHDGQSVGIYVICQSHNVVSSKTELPDRLVLSRIRPITRGAPRARDNLVRGREGSEPAPHLQGSGRDERHHFGSVRPIEFRPRHEAGYHRVGALVDLGSLSVQRAADSEESCILVKVEGEVPFDPVRAGRRTFPYPLIHANHDFHLSATDLPLPSGQVSPGSL